MTIIIFVIVIGIIIFVHELGHFLAAKGAGMRVDEFGFGFPPRIFGVKRGGTLYSLNWIPLGGFVRIKGENGEEAWENDSFAAKSMPRRILVILAGVSMNIILAFVLFTGGYIAGVPQAIDVPPAGAIVSAPTIQVGEVLVGSPASRGDLRTNDVIEEFNGQKATNADALRSAIKASAANTRTVFLPVFTISPPAYRIEIAASAYLFIAFGQFFEIEPLDTAPDIDYQLFGVPHHRIRYLYAFRNILTLLVTLLAEVG